VTDLWVSMPSIRVQVELGSSTLNRPISAWSVYVELCMVSGSVLVETSVSMEPFRLVIVFLRQQHPRTDVRVLFCFLCLFVFSVSNRTKAKPRITITDWPRRGKKTIASQPEFSSMSETWTFLYTAYCQDSLEIAVL